MATDCGQQRLHRRFQSLRECCRRARLRGLGRIIRPATELIEAGTFDDLKHGASYDELQRLFVQR